MTAPRVFARTLEDMLEDAVVPVCPTVCVWRNLCPSHIQAGINPLFVEGRYTTAQDCLWWSKLAALHLATTGHTVPGSWSELQQQLSEVSPRHRELLDPVAKAERDAIRLEGTDRAA